MRKACVIFLAVLLLSGLALTAFAAEQLQFTVEASDEDVHAGDTVVITVDVASDSACTSMGFQHQFDTAVFEFISGECLAQNTSMADFSAKDGVVVMFNGASAYDGALCRFTLRVRDDAAMGVTEVGGKAAAKNGGDFLSHQVTTAKITVSAESDVQLQPSLPQLPAVDITPVIPTLPDAVTGETSATETSETAGEQTTQPVTEPSLPTEEGEAPTQAPQTVPAETPGFPWHMLLISILLVAVAAGAMLLMAKSKRKE